MSSHQRAGQHKFRQGKMKLTENQVCQLFALTGSRSDAAEGGGWMTELNAGVFSELGQEAG